MENISSKTEAEKQLNLIEDMITNAKNEITNQSFPYLLWGWLVFIASTGHYVLQYVVGFKHPYVVWSLMFVGGIIHFIYGIRNKNKTRVRNYTEKALSGIWIAFIISMAFLLLSMYAFGPEIIYPLFILLYAIAIFATGYILDFKPFIFGAISNWIIASVCLFQPFEYQLLLLALAITFSYIIPGHMLNAKFSK